MCNFQKNAQKTIWDVLRVKQTNRKTILPINMEIRKAKAEAEPTRERHNQWYLEPREEGYRVKTKTGKCRIIGFPNLVQMVRENKHADKQTDMTNP